MTQYAATRWFYSPIYRGCIYAKWMTQYDATRWFYSPIYEGCIYTKWMPLQELRNLTQGIAVK